MINKRSQTVSNLLALPLFIFQIIVFLVHPNLPALLIVPISLFINLCWVAFNTTVGRAAFLETVIADFFERFNGCEYKEISLRKLLGSKEIINELDKESMGRVYINNSPVLNKLFGNSLPSVESTVSVFQVRPQNDELGNIFIGGASYTNDMGNTSVVFLPEYKLPAQRFQKFLAYHEIGHALFLSKVRLLEFKALRGVYILMLFFVPFQLIWAWQALLLFVTFVLTSLDFFGNGLLMRIRLARLESEIIADAYAVQMLTGAEKEYIVSKLKTGKVKIYDESLSPDENNLRFSRLISNLENEPFDRELVFPISRWDSYYRLLFLILLATNTYAPTYWHVLVGVLLLIILIVLLVLSRVVAYKLDVEVYIHLSELKK